MMKTGRANFISLLTAAICLGAGGIDTDKMHVDPNNLGLGLEHSSWGTEKLEEQVKQHPNSAEAYLERGNGRMLAGEDDAALADFDKVLTLDPHMSKAYIGRAIVFRSQLKWDKALAELKKAASMPPRDVAIDAMNLAASYCRLCGKAPQALVYLDEVIKSGLLSKKRLANSYAQRGMVLDKLGKAPQAIADYTNAIKINPYHGMAYIYRGNDYTGLGDFKKALADYNFVVEHVQHGFPPGVQADFSIYAQQVYRQRSILFSRMGRPDLAKADRMAGYKFDKEDIEMSPFQLR